MISYVLGRQAWDRKGMPDLLRETLPFWIISGCTAVVLITAGHLAGEFATDHHLAKLKATAVVAGTVLAASAVTFIIRFVIFHYVLFASERAPVKDQAPADPVDGESLTPVAVLPRSTN
jgi:branched-subunit amino acid transport protein